MPSFAPLINSTEQNTFAEKPFPGVLLLRISCQVLLEALMKGLDHTAMISRAGILLMYQVPKTVYQPVTLVQMLKCISRSYNRREEN